MIEHGHTGNTTLLASLDAIHAAFPKAAWMRVALCRETDPESFFPEKGGSTRAAKKVCLSCEVRAECLQYALDNDERWGIWGGLSERERRRLKRNTGGYNGTCVVCGRPFWAISFKQTCSDECKSENRSRLSRRQARGAA